MAIPTGLAVATASSEAGSGFRVVTVVADECVTAATWAAAGLAAYPEGLFQRGLPARLVAADGAVTYCGGWPERRSRHPPTIR